MELDEKVAEIMNQDLSLEETATALHEKLGMKTAEIAKILYEELDLDAIAVADALFGENGLGTESYDEPAAILHGSNGMDLDPAGVANVLYFSDTLDMSMEEVARELLALELPVAEVAVALRDGLACDAGAVAGVLHNSSEAVELSDLSKALHEGLNLSVEKTAKILHDPYLMGWGADEIARALHSGLHLSDAEVAKTLHGIDGLNLSAGEVALVLSDPDDGLGLPAAKVAITLHAPDGLNLPPADVARALSSGLNLHPSEVAQALSEGLGMDCPAIAKALEAGLSLSPTLAQAAADSIQKPPDHER